MRRLWSAESLVPIPLQRVKLMWLENASDTLETSPGLGLAGEGLYSSHSVAATPALLPAWRKRLDHHIPRMSREVW